MIRKMGKRAVDAAVGATFKKCQHLVIFLNQILFFFQVELEYDGRYLVIDAARRKAHKHRNAFRNAAIIPSAYIAWSRKQATIRSTASVKYIHIFSLYLACRMELLSSNSESDLHHSGSLLPSIPPSSWINQWPVEEEIAALPADHPSPASAANLSSVFSDTPLSCSASMRAEKSAKKV